MKRFIAHYMLAGGDGEQVRSDTIEGLWKFIESRISAVKSSSGGRSLCVGDTKSNSADWLWRMESGGTITYSHGKYGKIAALLFGGYSPAKDLRSIPSEKRSDASRTNGKKGGRPRNTITIRGETIEVKVKKSTGEAKNWASHTAHWRDKNGSPCSALVEKRNGKWIATQYDD